MTFQIRSKPRLNYKLTSFKLLELNFKLTSFKLLELNYKLTSFKLFDELNSPDFLRMCDLSTSALGLCLEARIPLGQVVFV